MPSQKADKLGCWHMDRFLYSVNKATTISKRMAMEQWKKLIVFEVRLNSKNNFMQIKGTSSIVNYWNISISFSYHGMDFISPPIWILLNTVLYQYFNIDFYQRTKSWAKNIQCPFYRSEWWFRLLATMVTTM